MSCKHGSPFKSCLHCRIEELEQQLPDGMKDCTIIFKECQAGHGRLTAENWADCGCPFCRIIKLEEQRTANALEDDENAVTIATLMKQIDNMRSYMQSRQMLNPEVLAGEIHITHWDNYLRLKGE